MKNTIFALTLLFAFSIQAQEPAYCKRGADAIEKQKELIKAAVQSGDISTDLELFFKDNLNSMIDNHNLLCETLKTLEESGN